jgi:hypothetical protein
MTLWFAACAGKSKLERPLPNGSDAGAGGEGTSAMAKGGSPGPVGTTGTEGGSSAGVEPSVDPDGRGNAGAGEGGMSATAKGGSPGRAGTSSTRGGSSAGVTASVDPHCDCVQQIGRFLCTSEDVTLPAGFFDPASCSFTNVSREACGDSFHYFLHDDGGDYELEVDATGKTTYFRALGDVAAFCGSAVQALGVTEMEITMGTPTEAACHDICTVCNPAGGNNFCMTCNEDPNVPGLALQSLTDYCGHARCPQSIDEARESLGPTCGSHRIVTHEYTGCGKVFFSRVYGSDYKLELTFDVASGKLESVHEEDTQRFGPCNAYAVQAGPAHVACADATDCNYCLEPEGGEGGGFAFHHAVCQ